MIQANAEDLMADKFSEIMVQLARRNSYQSSRAFRELSFFSASFSKAPQNQNRYSLVATLLLDHAAKGWLIAVRSEQKCTSWTGQSPWRDSQIHLMCPFILVGSGISQRIVPVLKIFQAPQWWPFHTSCTTKFHLVIELEEHWENVAWKLSRKPSIKSEHEDFLEITSSAQWIFGYRGRRPHEIFPVEIAAGICISCAKWSVSVLSVCLAW